ncbi:MAG: hypothetical protein ACLFWB_08380 [Armatimonadota bacterium]
MGRRFVVEERNGELYIVGTPDDLLEPIEDQPLPEDDELRCLLRGSDKLTQIIDCFIDRQRIDIPFDWDELRLSGKIVCRRSTVTGICYDAIYWNMTLGSNTSDNRMVIRWRCDNGRKRKIIWGFVCDRPCARWPRAFLQHANGTADDVLDRVAQVGPEEGETDANAD